MDRPQKVKQQNGFHPKMLKKSIILDRVHPSDFRECNLIYCCEQCSYYDPEKDNCVLGFGVEVHKREQQLKTYNLNGRLALCRFLEID